MNAWPILIAAGALTYAMRLSFILLMERLEVPRNLKQRPVLRAPGGPFGDHLPGAADARRDPERLPR